MDGCVIDPVLHRSKIFDEASAHGPCYLCCSYPSTAQGKYCSEALYVEPRSSESTSYMPITLALNSKANG